MKREIWNAPSQTASPTQTDKQLIPLILRYSQWGFKFMKVWKDTISDNPRFDNCRLVAAYSKNKNLGRFLVSSKLRPLEAGGAPHRNVNPSGPGFFKCCVSTKCHTCKFHGKDTKVFKSSVTGNSFDIRDKLSCKSENVIYLITCRICDIQYVGETSRELRKRLTDHRSAVKTHKFTPISLHFNSRGHSIFDIQAIAIEKIKEGPIADISRKQREAFWQNKLGTKFPQGLNGMPIPDY